MKKLFAFAMLYALCSMLFAQDGKVSVTYRLSKGDLKAGDKFDVIFEFDIGKGLHIYAPGKQGSEVPTIPVEVVPTKKQGFQFDPPHWPEPVTKEFPSLGKLKLYEGKTEIPVPVTIGKDADLSEALEFKISYQACDDKQCYFPQESLMKILLLSDAEVMKLLAKANIKVGNDSGGILSYEDKQISVNNRISVDEVLKPDAEFQKFVDSVTQPGGTFSGAVEKGFFAAMLVAFLAGLAASITPCVYPMIPLTVAFFSRQVRSAKLHSIALALTYVLGMSLTYSVLGVSAGLAGSAFGSHLGNKYVALGIATFFIIFGLSMFGVFEIRMPSFLATKVGGAKQGYLGAFVMGLLVGIVAAPCVGPIFGGVLTYIATTQNVVTGFAYSMAFAAGMGVLFFVLALFPGILPKSGAWLDVVKNIFGFLLFACAIWFASPVLSTKTNSLATGFLFFFLAAYLMKRVRYFPKLLSVLAIVAVIGGFLFTGGLWIKFHQTSLAETLTSIVLLSPEQGEWQSGESALAQAQKDGKPAIVDFYAKWCVQCRVLEKTTFSDAKVESAFWRFAKVKFDLTDNSVYNRAKNRYGILGLPTIAFYDSRGRYLGKTGHVDAPALIKILEKVK